MDFVGLHATYKLTVLVGAVQVCPTHSLLKLLIDKFKIKPITTAVSELNVIFG
jgi:hypothetical protein